MGISGGKKYDTVRHVGRYFSMSKLSRITPTPAQFRTAVEEEFGPVIRSAAGADGRLTRNEAARIAERPDFGWVVSDNAVNYLTLTGQQTVSAEKLIRKLGEYAESQAEQVAGPNQKLSLLEARSITADLQAEFFYLRGKGLPERVEPVTLHDAVWALAKAALDSESMTKLPGPPWQVMGKRHLIENLPHPSSKTRGIVYVADNNIYLSRAASTGCGVGLVGWYLVGQVPADLPTG